jgi:hypothetical protein
MRAMRFTIGISICGRGLGLYFRGRGIKRIYNGLDSSTMNVQYWNS